MEISSHAQYGGLPLDAFEKRSRRKLGAGRDSEVWPLARWTTLCFCSHSGNGILVDQILRQYPSSSRGNARTRESWTNTPAAPDTTSKPPNSDSARQHEPAVVEPNLVEETERTIRTQFSVRKRKRPRFSPGPFRLN